MHKCLAVPGCVWGLQKQEPFTAIIQMIIINAFMNITER